MKKQSKLLVALLVLALAMFSFAACGDKAEDPEPVEEPAAVTMADMPADLAAEVDKVKEYAADLGEQLSGEWAGTYSELLASGEEREWAGYDELLAPLTDYQTEIGAYYVYVLDAEAPDADEYTITLDASEDPDDWGEAYDYEVQFQEAWEGTASTARSAWDNDTDDPVWSAFAPITDSEGNVVAIIGIDFPLEIILDYPEWNRDADEWNGLEE